ncbi:MAG: YceI family protein [Ginsengibacter sp.]
MKKYIKSLALIAILGFANTGYTQSIYKIKDSKDVAMKLSGTSTLKKWDMEAKTATGEAQFVFKTGSDNDLESVQSLSLSLKVKDLQSDNKKLNKHAYKALKADEFKNINYKLTSSTLSAEKGGYLLKAKGKLTIKGITNDIVMDVHIVVNKNSTVTGKGSYKLNMTDYKVDPPTFLVGAMKTGDTVTLDFTVVYKK